ncbi:hypothetical protein BKA69DRAFT_776939 [Paraphysoderma sedebokerense]|nr:hypothetical protein BKA69DRAFT_776939 [Paraphysoderma sedebokerense]
MIDAIRLTKCEIATANIQAPMECQDFDNVTTCVESLSRIPQLWTSYSGYFRDVVSMCFAVRHEIQRGNCHYLILRLLFVAADCFVGKNNKDLLESLFQNLTFTQILNSRLLLSHKSQLIALQNATNASLEYILNSYSSLKGYTVDVTSSLTNLTSNVTSLSTSLVAVLKLLTEVGKQQNDTESLIRDLLFITDRLKSDIKDTKENMDSMKMDIVVVEGDIDRAQRNLKTWMENLDAVLTSIERRVPNLGTKLTEVCCRSIHVFDFVDQICCCFFYLVLGRFRFNINNICRKFHGVCK